MIELALLKQIPNRIQVMFNEIFLGSLRSYRSGPLGVTVRL